MSRSEPSFAPSEAPSASRFRLAVMLFAGGVVGILLAGSLAKRILPPPAIADSILAEPRLVERTAAFAPALASASPESLPRLMDVLASFEPGPQDADLVLFADWWASFDPKAANAWAKQLEAGSGRRIRHGVFRSWARSDPSMALAFATASFAVSSPLQANTKGSWENPGVQAVLIGWDESGAPGLEQWIFEVQERQERQGLMELLANRRAITMEPEAVWKWADELPEPLRQDMLPRVASALAARAPEQAVRLATPFIEQGEAGALPRRIATRWAKRDPQAAFEWLSQILEGPERRDAVLESARTWITRDRVSFQAYMEERLEEFPAWLEPAFGLYARTLARDDRAEQGLTVAARIRDQGTRDYNVTLILRYWLVEDRSAAASWIEAHDVPEPIRRRAGFDRRGSS